MSWNDVLDVTYTRLYNSKHRLYTKIKRSRDKKLYEDLSLEPLIDIDISNLQPGWVNEELSKLREKFIGFNEWLCEKMSQDENFFRAVMRKCADGLDGLLFWIDAFGYTFNPRLKKPHLKMVLYDFQEHYVWWRYNQIEKQKSGLTEKSRDVGASWINMYVTLWYWLFGENGNFLVGSYREEYVDGASDKALMPKLDYALERLPQRMLPPGYRAGAPWKKFKLRKNPITGSNVEGEATSDNFGRGARKRLVDFDEFPVWPHPDKAKRSASRTADCLLFTGTPNGMGGEFAHLRHETDIDRMTLHISRHPEYQEGVYTCTHGCHIHNDGGFFHSDRYNKLCYDMYQNNPSDIAQEMDIDYLRSAGVAVFNNALAQKCASIVKKQIRDGTITLTRYALDWVKPDDVMLQSEPNAYRKASKKWSVVAREKPGAPLRVWRLPFSCTDKKCPCGGTGKHVYLLCGDVSQGLPNSDHTVALIIDCTAGLVVAEWLGKMQPEEAAEEWVKLSKFYGTSSGGEKNAYCAIEANFHGATVNAVMDKMGCEIHVSKVMNSREHKLEPRLGVVITPGNKAQAISEKLIPVVNKAMPNGWPILFCPFYELYEQMLTFVTHASTNGEVNAERPVMRGQQKKKDDHIMALTSGVIGAEGKNWKVKGQVRKQKINQQRGDFAYSR